jgi:hypothetical protein
MMNKFTTGQSVRVREGPAHSYNNVRPFNGLIGHVVSESEWLVNVSFEVTTLGGNTVFPFRRGQLEAMPGL